MDDSHTLSNILLPPDRILSCQHCGIQFVWTGWEQRHDDHSPQFCCGCRHLLAMTPRWGVVKWYDRRKGFGFITMPDGTDVYVRRHDVRGVRRLSRGQVVSFRLKQGKNGPRAIKVKVHKAT